MNKSILVIVGFFFFTSGKSQELQIEKGQQIITETILYANALPFDKKWKKLKQEKKDALVSELNENILTGRQAPWRTSSAKFEVINIQKSDNASSYTIKAFDSGFEYQTTNYVSNDTTYLVRNADPVYSILNKDTLGMAVQGIQRISNIIKVGDQLSQYFDFAFTFPKTWTSKMSEKVFAGRKTETHNDFGIHTDTNTGIRSLGNFKITTTSNVYNTVSHEVEISENITNNTIHYFVAYCTDTEEVEIGGKKQTAYIIESQQWSKAKLNRNYNAERQDLANKTEVEFEKFQQKMAKKAVKRGFTNPEGYVVSYFKEWFLPGYGIVKSESYDIHGAIQSQSKVIF